MLEFAGRFSNPSLLIKDFKHWAVVFKEQPSTLGQCAFILKRETPDFSSIKSEEMSEFPEVCKWYETKIKNLYGASKFNYYAVMMKEHFVHFNVYPRYSAPVNIYNLTWIDDGWPKKLIDIKLDFPEETKQQMIMDLKNKKTETNNQ